MEQEKDWLKERIKYSNEKLRQESFEGIDDIVAEATRRGMEQGKREALEEMKKRVRHKFENTQTIIELAIKENKLVSANAAMDRGTAYLLVGDDIQDKLASLDNSSKQDL